MFVTLIAAVISTQPSPLQEVQYRSYDVAGALKRGCKVQRVSISGGKAEHAPIIRCSAQQLTSPGDAKEARRSRG